jgi:hypothetical protein
MDALKGREKTISIVVFGCGLAFGLTGLYSYYRSRKITSGMRREMRSLSLVVENLKQEVEQLRQSSQRQSPITLQVPSRTTVRFHDEADAASDIASGDEEFYDFAEP